MPRDGGRTETDTAVAATPAALEVIHHLGAAHGPLVFVQSGRRHDGGPLMRLTCHPERVMARSKCSRAWTS